AGATAFEDGADTTISLFTFDWRRLGSFVRSGHPHGCAPREGKPNIDCNLRLGQPLGLLAIRLCRASQPNEISLWPVIVASSIWRKTGATLARKVKRPRETQICGNKLLSRLNPTLPGRLRNG